MHWLVSEYPCDALNPLKQVRTEVRTKQEVKFEAALRKDRRSIGSGGRISVQAATPPILLRVG